MERFQNPDIYCSHVAKERAWVISPKDQLSLLSIRNQ